MPKSNQVYTGIDVTKLGVKQIFDRSIKQLKSPTNQPGTKLLDDTAYDFTHSYRGFGIVICNACFSTGSPRPYADDELAHMDKMFSKLEFQVLMFKDLTVQHMIDVLEEAASRKEINKNADAFALAIGSHGNELEASTATDKSRFPNKNFKVFYHAVYGTDGAVLTADLLSIFDDSNCRELQGKPKLFFIQACRSRFGKQCNADMGIEVKTVETIWVPKPTSKSKDLTESGDNIQDEDQHSKGAEEEGQQAPAGSQTQGTGASGNNTRPEMVIQTRTSVLRMKVAQDVFDVDGNDDGDDDGGDDHDGDDDHNSDDDDENTAVNTDTEVSVGHTANENTNTTKQNVLASEGTTDRPEGLVSMLKKLNPFKKKKKKPSEIYAPYCPNNFLVMFATSSEKFAYGRDNQGGWMLYVLGWIFGLLESPSKIEFVVLMTEVCNRVAQGFQTRSMDLNGAKTAVTIEHRLHKDIYFLKKNVT